MQNVSSQPKINPLSSLMRQPKIYIKLPSQGKYWPEGSINLEPTGEYPVYSMTAKDELMIKTPDALLNGQAVVSVLQSCIPNIINAWDTPSIDLDALLIAIRLATYGQEMETTISIAGQEASYTVDLRDMLDQLSHNIDWDERVEVNDTVIIYVRPLTYKEISVTGLQSFETQRILNLVNDESLTEDRKLELFTQSFNKLTEITLGSVAQSIYKIDTIEVSVTDHDYIKDFIQNCDKEIFNRVKKHLDKLTENNGVKPLKVKATEDMIAAGSNEEVEVPIVFDASNFFA